MAVAFNAASQADGGGTGPSVSHTAAGSDRFVLIGLALSGAASVSAISYGAQTPTQIGSTNGAVRLYGLIAPSTGAQTVSVTLSESNQYVLGVISFTGVHQTTAVGTSVPQSNTELTSIAATVTSANDGMVADIVWMIRDAIAADGSQTERVVLDSLGGGSISVGMSTKPGSASVTMTWTADMTFGDNNIIAVPIAAAAGSSGAPRFQSFRLSQMNN